MIEGTPLWFGPEERPLFGWVHAPDDGRSQGAVVLCPPLARELTSAHFTYRLLARALARAGLTAVRFDLDGTGDSAGDDRDPDRVESWIGSVEAAVGLARRTGARTVGLVGMRMGALLALQAAARTPVDAAVLWDPCPSGRRFLKEQRSMYLVQYGPSPGPEDFDLPGYRYTAETARRLGELRPPGADQTAPARVLVLTRRGERPPRGLIAGAAPGATDWEEVDGQAELLNVEPLRQTLPVDTVERVAAWLAEALPRCSHPVQVPERLEIAMAVDGGCRVLERIVRLGPLGLFGIETAPADLPHTGPTVLMLSAGNDWHAGPNRLWVHLARRWAAAGVRSVRFDASGLGDSPVRPGQREHVVRAPEAFDDVEAAVAAVEPDDPSNVVLVGLCSGGYQALESALLAMGRGLAPRGVLAVNPILRFTPPEVAEGPPDPRRRIHKPVGNLGRAVRRSSLAVIARRGRSVAWRLANRFGGDRAPAAWLAELVEAGVDVLCVCGEHEARPLLEGGRKAIDALVATGRLRIDVVEGLDHALMPFDQRDHVAGELTGCVLERFAPAHPPVVARG